MAAEIVNEQTILAELHQVPQDCWENVLAFIRSLRQAAPATADTKRALSAAELLQSGLVGMWANRTDLGDRHEFARRLREQAQTRGRNQ